MAAAAAAAKFLPQATRARFVLQVGGVCLAREEGCQAMEMSELLAMAAGIIPTLTSPSPFALALSIVIVVTSTDLLRISFCL